MTEDQLLIEAQKIHDRECRCDPKYLRSCVRFAAAILSVPKVAPFVDDPRLQRKALGYKDVEDTDGI